ncbi:DUF2634 domain-containing protein [Brevibacillus laterosporus]|uniref:DUF2634 domain-containing protein n=1 Tax=Brevibacillus laterosporus TaxID=1465 RepID=A0AAP3GE93_BRELA|nr:DUF2634 domain-containing protein [Brevibacillus laterosporus]MCR8983263.1 DUF2634 domain-containing protein [Brevibacillus laterosporus]MCZ0810419.1 DUF2634 domain-containing protein [Brevibacillus laterosporus]MCZ0828545.1 DUF2634 domain-containing protein [Brevibacillus laterosporus]MCZ0853083.1 DUF2634 domain-containing protein [Brevibacillus laterosporus]
MFPVFEEDKEVKEEKETIPWTYKMDWSTRQLIKGADGRHVKTSTYAEYLEEIAKKILHTKRFQYEIYSDRIGVDFFEHIGQLPKHVPLAIIRRDVEDALEAHSEIEAAEVTDISLKEKRVVFSVQIEGIRGKTKAVIDIWGKR